MINMVKVVIDMDDETLGGEGRIVNELESYISAERIQENADCCLSLVCGGKQRMKSLFDRCVMEMA